GLARRAGGRDPRAARRTPGALLLRPRRRGRRSAACRPSCPSAARAARGRAWIRNGREPQLLGGDLASQRGDAGPSSAGGAEGAMARPLCGGLARAVPLGAADLLIEDAETIHEVTPLRG